MGIWPWLRSWSMGIFQQGSYFFSQDAGGGEGGINTVDPLYPWTLVGLHVLSPGWIWSPSHHFSQLSDPSALWRCLLKGKFAFIFLTTGWSLNTQANKCALCHGKKLISKFYSYSDFLRGACKAWPHPFPPTGILNAVAFSHLEKKRILVVTGYTGEHLRTEDSQIHAAFLRFSTKWTLWLIME